MRNSPRVLQSFEVTIANGATTSSILDSYSGVICAMIIPAMTGTQITFTSSIDGSNFYDYYDQYGSQPSVVVSASARYIEIDEEDFVGAQYLKVVSNATEGAERTITFIARPL